jgi:uncharacterized DUF497 family protein
MAVEFDPGKAKRTLDERGLDMARSEEIFAGRHLEVVDTRMDYGETRYIVIGHLDERMVVLVWTPRGNDRRIISLRKANEREQTIYGPRFAR